MSRAPGPRATPLIIGDAVYTVGATRRLHRLDSRTGKVVWAHDLFNEFKGQVQDEYYAASPLAYRGKPRWAQRDVPKASFINVNGRFITLAGTTLYLRDRKEIVALDAGGR